MTPPLEELNLTENELRDEQPMPDGWVWTQLGDVCLKPQYGWTTSAAREGTLHLLRTTDITPGNIDWGTVPFCKKEPPERDKYLLRDGDIVVSRAGSVGFSHLVRNPKEAVFASYLIRFKPLIDERYVAFFLKSPPYWAAISEKSIGIAIPNVNATKLRQIWLPVPPLPEQHRIVAKIEELFTQLDAGVAALEKAKAQLRRYRQAVLKAAVEGELTREWREAHRGELEPASVLLERILEERRVRWEAEQFAKMQTKGKLPTDNKWKQKYKKPVPPDASKLLELPEGWVWATVEQIGKMRQYGTSEKADRDPSGIPVLRMGNIQDGKLDFSDLKYLPARWPKTDDFVLQEGDVLFNRTNSAELVGKTAVYKAFHPRAVFASYLIRVRTNDAYLPDLLSFCINSFHGRRYIASVVSQQVGQANVSGTKLSKMPIPFPPLSEQHRIVAEVEQRLSVADEMAKAVEQSLKRAERLRQSILKRAFEGKLVPQDPSDEAASVLLGRIKVEKSRREAEGKGTRRSRRQKRPRQLELFTS
jgi:type I restriction enzyme S subunit